MFGKTNAELAKKLTSLVPRASSLNLKEKKVLVIGGTDGLGRAIANLAASKGASVTVAGRVFRDSGVPNISFVQADLSLMKNAKKLGEELKTDFDAIFFTNGIVPGNSYKTTSEGVEIDMAVSSLSRKVILDNYLPRISKKTRIFIMGFPGTGEKGNVDDLNSEKKFETGFGITHMNTVALNESLVFTCFSKSYLAYGLHPGLISTGIRNGMWTGVFSYVMESLINCFSISPAKYAENVLPLAFTPELEKYPGSMFGQSGTPILPSPAFTDPSFVQKYENASTALANKALSSYGASK
jgi:NAD(P)-dependent dehydrogenase (short-subunit alcohol dehydrogenase family)